MRVQHNITAMNAYRNYNNNSSTINKNIEKLSSGYKINRAGDNAAGLAISEKMRAQITGLEGAQKNAKDGISLVQTAEGALTEVHSMLNRMYELAEQSANGTYGDEVDRAQLQKEVDSIKTEINRIADSANFNGITLLNGDRSASGSGAAIAAELADTGDIKSGVSLTDFKTADASADDTAGTAITDEQIAAAIKELSKSSIDLAAADDGSGNVDWDASVTISNNADDPQWTLAASYDSTNKTVTITATNATDSSISGDIGTFTLEQDANTTLADQDIATFNLSASSSGPMTLQVGDTSDSFNQMSVSMDSIKTTSLGAYDVQTNDEGLQYKVLKADASGDGEAPTTIDDIDIGTQTGAQKALDVVKAAINYVSDTRGGLGAIQNRLEHTINNLSVMQENMQDAESTIRDTDVADEMMKYTKNSILVQSAQAMLAQANQQPQGVLQLLQ